MEVQLGMHIHDIQTDSSDCIAAIVVVETAIDPNLTEVFFEPAHYTVMENVGSMEVAVKRAGGNLNCTLYVDYTTEDGSANAGSDYEAARGGLDGQGLSL